MNDTNQPGKTLVVVSSVSQDDQWLQALQPHLSLLGQYGNVDTWNESDIAAGDDRFEKINESLRAARIVICLISVDYLNAIRNFESFSYLLEERQRGGKLLLPILVRPCPWQIVPWLKRIQMFPRDNKPISTNYQGREDEVFTEVVLDVYERSPQLMEEAAERNDAMGVSFGLNAVPSTEDVVRDIVTRDVTFEMQVETELPADVRENIQRLPETGNRLFGRIRELALLDAAWREKATNVVSLIAWGGVGKSTLVNRWLEQMRDGGYHGARRVYGWSFYSQGTKEQVTSSDLFFDETLRWFGAEGFEQQSIWEKAELLAGLIREEPTLLVLDGVEPLQSGADFDKGVFRDGGLQCLLQELIRDNPGLCVVTSRAPLADFQNETTAISVDSLTMNDEGQIEQLPSAQLLRLDLETISAEAGRNLLKTEFVQGTNEELEQATREFGCNALAVSLLGSWLHEIPGHHVSERSRIPELDVPEEAGLHARRVLTAFEELLGDSAELELLRIMGLFDRPATLAEVQAVLEGDVIAGLTSHYVNDTHDTLRSAAENLRQLRLLDLASEHRPDDFDCHPMIREHFAARLDVDFADSAREAHRRLYEYLKQSAPEFPDNLRDMMPLFHAVAHACKADLAGTVFGEIFVMRIMRSDAYFSLHNLRAVGAVLSAVSNFFVRPWQTVSGAIPHKQQSLLLNLTGAVLREAGRLTEAIEPIQLSLDSMIDAEQWQHAADIAGNLSEAYLSSGNVASAVRQGEQSIEFADRDDEWYTRMLNRSVLAVALHATGRMNDEVGGTISKANSSFALAAFEESEAIQQTEAPSYPLLYALVGYWYCQVLLDQSAVRRQRIADVADDTPDELQMEIHSLRNRAEVMLEIAETRLNTFLNLALAHLTLGRTWLAEVDLLQSQNRSFQSQWDIAKNHLTDSVNLLHRANVQEYLTQGLLHRAVLWRVKLQTTPDESQLKLAERDLSEAETIAKRGSMLIHQIEAALERTRLYLATGNLDSAREKLDEAKRLVKQTEKPYEPYVPMDEIWPDGQKWEPPEYVGVFKQGDIVGYHRCNGEIERLERELS